VTYGEGVPAEEGDAVGTTVGGGVPARCVVLVAGAGLVGVTRAVGPGVVDGRAAVGRGVEGTAVDEPAGCAGAWGPAAPEAVPPHPHHPAREHPPGAAGPRARRVWPLPGCECCLSSLTSTGPAGGHSVPWEHALGRSSGSRRGDPHTMLVILPDALDRPPGPVRIPGQALRRYGGACTVINGASAVIGGRGPGRAAK